MRATTIANKNKTGAEKVCEEGERENLFELKAFVLTSQAPPLEHSFESRLPPPLPKADGVLGRFASMDPPPRTSQTRPGTDARRTNSVRGLTKLHPLAAAAPQRRRPPAPHMAPSSPQSAPGTCFLASFRVGVESA